MCFGKENQADCRYEGCRRTCVLQIPNDGKMRRLSFPMRLGKENQADCRYEGCSCTFARQAPNDGEMRRLSFSKLYSFPPTNSLLPASLQRLRLIV